VPSLIFERDWIILTSIFCSLNFIFSYFLTKASIRLATFLRILDDPKTNPSRKKQIQAIPLMGATGFIFSSVFFTVLSFVLVKAYHDFDLIPFVNYQTFGFLKNLSLNLAPFKIGWILTGILILLIAGFLDDKFQFSSKIMILPVALSLVLTVFLGEIRIESFSYPFDQIIPSNSFWPSLLAIFWLGVCTTATKFLDGLDGLVGSIGIIAFLAITIVALQSNVNQPFIALIGLVWASGILGFLPFNLPDAKVYLGEGGSLIIGYLIGVLSILSGAKVATAASVIGWFVYDILFVMLIRILNKKNPLQGDRRHWHFRLQDLGLTKTQALILTISIISLTAILGLILPTEQKIYLLISQAILLVGLFIFTEILSRKKE